MQGNGADAAKGKDMNNTSDRLVWVKNEFDRIATQGVLGDPTGTAAFGYLRVSSTGQAEEGRSGFPRQLLHVHEKAYQLHLSIPWELVFFDDHTGFEFRDRPALTRLRELVRSPQRPADTLVIENIDRLSREATWHQGFLLEEFEKEQNVHIHFWKELPSKLERVVYGTVAQDRMLTDLERMAMGNIHKAKSGRVTARTAAYGYKIVNGQGGDENAKKDSHYAFNEPEAAIMRQIYRWLIEDHATLLWISKTLVERGVKAPKRSRTWEPSTLQMLLKNPIYKGEFYAHRKMEVKEIDNKTGKTVKRRKLRPQSEWILVRVPALVSAEMWQEAQRVVSGNKTKSVRNSKQQYLLGGLLYCADCKTIKMSSSIKYTSRTTRQGSAQYEMTFYRCNNRTRAKHIAHAMGYQCAMPQITSKVLDALVWNTVVQTLLNRERLEEGMARYFSEQRIETTKEEIAFVQAQLTELELEDEKLYQAYIADVFDAQEYAEKRHGIKGRRQSLEEEKLKLQHKLSHQSDRDEQKAQILSTVDRLKKRAEEQLPFELKRNILTTVIDKIVVNTREEWFEIEGAISGKFDFVPAGRGSSRRSG